MRDFSRSLPMALLRAREAVMERFRPMLREHGVTEQQWRVLRALSDKPDAEVTALAADCCLLMPSLSRILQNLSRRGLVTRNAHASDLRRVVVSITPKGRALIRTVAPHSEHRYEVIARRFGDARLEQLHHLLNELAVSLAEDRPD